MNIFIRIFKIFILHNDLSKWNLVYVYVGYLVLKNCRVLNTLLIHFRSVCLTKIIWKRFWSSEFCLSEIILRRIGSFFRNLFFNSGRRESRANREVSVFGRLGLGNRLEPAARRLGQPRHRPLDLGFFIPVNLEKLFRNKFQILSKISCVKNCCYWIVAL